ncbi:hypothetical protein FNYG_09575 [Fusarium nygamai]|uniref:Uncharacterized protein n=1 Tax=Gibberella nygamai TaxID=42673 RepID=A0A2K0W3V3_GIBNY|nr:hypothetical protein FNYG_09575 [Fusarium nygamai]
MGMPGLVAEYQMLAETKKQRGAGGNGRIAVKTTPVYKPDPPSDNDPSTSDPPTSQVSASSNSSSGDQKFTPARQFITALTALLDGALRPRRCFHLDL